MRKTTKKKIAPVVMAILVILYVAPMMYLILTAAGLFDGGEGVMLLFPFICWLIVGGAVIVGVLRAMIQRLREIDGGEEDDARQY